MNTGTSQISYPVANFYDRTLLMRAVPYFMHTLYAQVRDLPQKGTNVIKFRRYTNLIAATTALVEGVTPAGSQLSITDVTATVNQYGDFLTFTDWVDLTDPDPVLTENAQILGDQMGDTLDQLCRDVIVAGTTVLYASTATARNQVTATMKLTNTEAKSAVRTLKNNKAKKLTRMINPSTGIATTPVNACFIGFVHPDTTYDLKADSNFLPVEKYPNQADVMPHEIGKLDEIRFIESPNAKIFTAAGASSANVYATVIIASDAYAISRISGAAIRNIIKAFNSGGTADPLEQRQTSGWKATFVAARLNETFMVRIEHGTTFS